MGKMKHIMVVMLLALTTLGQAKDVLLEQYIVSRLDLTSGLPHNNVNQIFVDSQGFVWISCYGGGAVRYDGYLSLLPHVANNARSLLSEEDYRAWLGTVSAQAQADARATQEHWNSRRVKWVEDIQRWIMDRFLKHHGISAGARDYTGVVGIVITMDARP